MMAVHTNTQSIQPHEFRYLTTDLGLIHREEIALWGVLLRLSFSEKINEATENNFFC